MDSCMYKATGDFVCKEKFSDPPVANSLGQGSHSWLKGSSGGSSAASASNGQHPQGQGQATHSYASVEAFEGFANPFKSLFGGSK